jgi:hypothetical protein
VFTVGQFLGWQRDGSLKLKPVFQRRQVWKSKAKSLLIDTVVKGLPIPIIFLRSTQDLDSLTSGLEVVDGQQRLRTLFSFIDPSVLGDYSPEKDDFHVSRAHNKSLADTPFAKLPEDVRSDILGYEISTHIFPLNTDDELILRVFARLNSTGSKLNSQELRNAQYFGYFKTLAYDLAIPQLPRWRRWGVFSEDDFARMQEVEAVSDYVMAIMRGIQGKSKAKLDKLYAEFEEDEIPGGSQLARKFDRVMEAIDEACGSVLPETRLRRQALFYSFFVACYDHIYGLGSKYSKQQRPRSLPADIANRLHSVDDLIRSGSLPEKVQDAMDKATADKGRRDRRHKFLMEKLGLASASAT